MSGEAVFKDPKDLANGDMVVLDSGRLDIYNKIDGVRTVTPTTTLKKCESKSAPLNAWTELEGYWQEPPAVLVSPKRVPTYFSRGRYGRQRFQLGCSVAASDSPLKYRIYPSCKFTIEAGSSGTIKVGESINLWPEGSFYFPTGNSLSTIITSAQSGMGSLTVSFSWRTMYGYSNATPGTADFRANIYLDVLRAGASGSPVLETHLLVSESFFAMEQPVQTTVKTVSLGGAPCAWWLRKEGDIQNIRTGTRDIGYEHSLTLNSYSCVIPGEEFYPTDGEVFYLAIGR
ncbi:hypothetical protein [Cloacibacillus evryensis]|uniref:hypothetical protein n=1 Tax=Cloacibacillus evryensis TaxID=508460 RepID=UPI00044A60BC|nr:hypothetical protein [Cloacibacillus evryensis]EXG78371.1 hypothetical protein Cloev_0489 [Cloacibacillus evryensis DSM 19522]MEA5034852.1 hypothetical protein [Cloacibacillus evryensis]